MLVLCFQSACTIETSDNGDLDGYWHLEQVDTLATGGKLNLSKERVFWGVQHKLISCEHHRHNGKFPWLLFPIRTDW